MNTAEILRAAAGRVRQGWTQFIREDHGRFCALGAISVVDSGNSYRDEQPSMIATTHAARALRLPFNNYGQRAAVATWNNADGQTAENVAVGLEYAALLWEQEQAQVAEQPQEVAVAK